MITFIGIDPGVNGGIAILYEPDLAEVMSFSGMTDQGMIKLFANFNNHSYVAMLERVHALPSNFRGSSASWTLAENFGKIKMLLAMSDIQYSMIMPDQWMKVMKIPKRGKSTHTQHKRGLVAKAQALFPKVTGIDMTTADALLIAEFNRRIYK